MLGSNSEPCLCGDPYCPACFPQSDNAGPMSYEERITEAIKRGRERGYEDKMNDCVTDSPLSGERAGESINELLGDVLYLHDEDTEDANGALLDAYEDAYWKASHPD